MSTTVLISGTTLYHVAAQSSREAYHQMEQVPVVKCEFPGLPKIVVEKNIDEQLSVTRDARLAIQRGAHPDFSPAQSTFLPEQIADAYRTLPRTGHVSEMILLSSPYQFVPPSKISHSGNPLAETEIDSGSIRLYELTNSSGQLMWSLKHEYGHTVEKEKAIEAFHAAADLESSGYMHRDYAKESVHEDAAVHAGEVVLNGSPEQLAEFATGAPARALALLLLNSIPIALFSLGPRVENSLEGVGVFLTQ